MHNERLSIFETAKGKPEADCYHLYRQELAKLMEAKSAEEVERIGGELRDILSAIRSRVSDPYSGQHGNEGHLAETLHRASLTERDDLSPDKTL